MTLQDFAVTWWEIAIFCFTKFICIFTIKQMNHWHFFILYKDRINSTIMPAHSFLNVKKWRICYCIKDFFIFYANYDKGLQEDEDNRLRKILSKYSNFTYQFHGISSFVRGINGKEKTVITKSSWFRIFSSASINRNNSNPFTLNIKANNACVVWGDEIRWA